MTTVAETVEAFGGELRLDRLGEARTRAIRTLAVAIIGRETVKGATLENAKDHAAYDILLVMGLLGGSARTHEDRLDRAAVRAIIDSLGG